MIVTQDMFTAALLDAALPAPEGLQDAQARPAGRRFAVYRNNVAHSLREALAQGFPACAAILGPANFNAIAGAYQASNPPQSPLLMLYGKGFAGFLATLDLPDMPWLADLARLEYALRCAYHAADAAPLPPQALAAVAPAALPGLRLHLAPAVRLLRSAYPLLAIRAQALGLTPAGGSGPTDSNTPETGEILITRTEFDPAPHALPLGGAALIEALPHMPHGAALDAAPDLHDPAAVLCLLASTGAITRLEETTP